MADLNLSAAETALLNAIYAAAEGKAWTFVTVSPDLYSGQPGAAAAASLDAQGLIIPGNARWPDGTMASRGYLLTDLGRAACEGH